MTDNNIILQKLRENNPFSSHASPLPWENTNPDLQNLNRQTSDRIEQLIRKKRLEPAVPLAGLILGEAGSGKTHMLTRILRRLRNNAQLAIFTAVKAFYNPESVMQNIFSEIFNSLKLPHSKGRSQFDVVISEFMNTYRERRHNDGFDSTENLDLRSYIRKDIPGLSRNFLKCLMLYMSAKDEGVKIDILEWLREGLDDEESLRLGLPSRNRDTMKPSEREQDAANVLVSLGHVLSYARVPLVLCFDQLDNIKNTQEPRKLITSWGNSVALLMNDLTGIIPLCFVRSAIWNEKFVPVLDEAVEQRISSNKMTMYSCTVEQAKQLVHDKIAASFTEDSEEIYSWLISRMPVTQEYSPRQVIEIANRVINGESIDDTAEITKIITEAFYDEYKKIQAVPLAWPPNAEQLTLALEVWLSSLEGFTAEKSKGKYIKLQGIHGDKKFAFIVLTAKGHSTASAALKAGMSFMKEYPSSECFYISEDKTHKSTWKQANENLRKFVEYGGHSLILTEDSRINWYALTALINRVDNGDVNIYSSASSRTATRKDILDFVRTLSLIDSQALRFSPASITYAHPSKPDSKSKPEPKIYFDDKLFSATLSSIITASPMKILAVDKAAELLSQRGINAGRNEVISFVRNHTESFRTFTSKNNDILITLEGRN